MVNRIIHVLFLSKVPFFPLKGAQCIKGNYVFKSQSIPGKPNVSFKGPKPLKGLDVLCVTNYATASKVIRKTDTEVI